MEEELGDEHLCQLYGYQVSTRTNDWWDLEQRSVWQVTLLGKKGFSTYFSEVVTATTV
jgi:hypothetical protein